jgi:hypothetical protein
MMNQEEALEKAKYWANKAIENPSFPTYRETSLMFSAIAQVEVTRGLWDQLDRMEAIMREFNNFPVQVKVIQ